MSKWVRRQRRFSDRFSAVSAVSPAEESAHEKTPLKNGKNGDAPAPPKANRGHFAKGNPGGPGRPRKPTQAAFQAATLSVIPVESWEKVVAKALEDAQSGDKHARDWLSAYAIGRPVPVASVDGIPAPLLERLIGLLRGTGHDPEQVFENIILRLEKLQETRPNGY